MDRDHLYVVTILGAFGLWWWWSHRQKADAMAAAGPPPGLRRVDQAVADALGNG